MPVPVIIKQPLFVIIGVRMIYVLTHVARTVIILIGMLCSVSSGNGMRASHGMPVVRAVHTPKRTVFVRTTVIPRADVTSTVIVFVGVCLRAPLQSMTAIRIKPMACVIEGILGLLRVAVRRIGPCTNVALTVIVRIGMRLCL